MSRSNVVRNAAREQSKRWIEIRVARRRAAMNSHATFYIIAMLFADGCEARPRRGAIECGTREAGAKDARLTRPHHDPGVRRRPVCSGAEAAARPHQSDAIELGLFACALDGALAHLVALVEQLHLLQLFERLAERRLGFVELPFELIGRAPEILAPLDGGLGIGRIGKMRRIMNTGTILFGLDLAIEVDGHAFEFGDHGLDLRDPAPLLVDLKLPQANERLTRLHRLVLPRSPELVTAPASNPSVLPRMPQPHRLRSCQHNVSFRFPDRLRFARDGYSPRPGCWPRPCPGRGIPQAGHARRSPGPPRGSSRDGRLRAGSVPPCRRKSP